MRKILFGSLLALTILAVPPAMAQNAPRQAPMTLSTTAFADGTQIPVKFTAAGQSTSPDLKWTNAPEGTQSFVLHMHDLDVARNKTTDDQLHWLVWNIPATTTELPEGVPSGSPRPDGSMQASASGDVYRGPGAGANGPLHHYTFQIFALDTKLDVTPDKDPFETRKKVLAAMQGHILGTAAYGGLFRRPN